MPHPHANVPMTDSEMFTMLHAIGIANMHENMSPLQRQCASWIASRIERILDERLRSEELSRVRET